jgi:LmbE family N-acetylglucosaminyl deacetylase
MDQLNHADHSACLDSNWNAVAHITQPMMRYGEGGKERESDGNILARPAACVTSQKYPSTPFSPASATFLTEEGQRHQAAPQQQTQSGLTATAASELAVGTYGHSPDDASPTRKRPVDGGGTAREITELHLRQDCLRALATFFHPGSAKELNVHASMREEVIRKVESSKKAVDPSVVSE